MRCRTCEYRLWNLTSRQCPECGTPFLPSDYEFTANSVQFQCPHCNQSYYGTGAKGHLVPPRFVCVGCDKTIHMNEMVLLPTEGLEEEQTSVQRSPWLERKRIGFFKGWLRTVGKAMVGPGELMRLTPSQSSAAEAWWFGLLNHWAVAVLSMSFFLAIPIAMGISGAFGGSSLGGAIGGLVTFLGFVIFGPLVFSVTVIAVWGLLIHGILRLTGETAWGIDRTYQAVCYSSACVAPAAVPCLGFYIYPVGCVWWAVSAVLMILEGQRVGPARAIAAVSLPAVLGLAGIVGAFAYSISQTNSWATQTMRQIPNAEVQKVVDGVLAYGKKKGDAFPGHAIELVTGEQLDEYAFVTGNSSTGLSGVPVGALTLEEFAKADASEREAAGAACKEGLPPGTIAHRLGDFVFTYHGMDAHAADEELWVVVRWEDPDSNRGIGRMRTTTGPAGMRVTTYSSGWLWVGLASGEVRSIPASLFDNELKRQNDLRAEHGLAPLPHPEDVTHDSPAVASKGADRNAVKN